MYNENKPQKLLGYVWESCTIPSEMAAKIILWFLPCIITAKGKMDLVLLPVHCGMHHRIINKLNRSKMLSNSQGVKQLPHSYPKFSSIHHSSCRYFFSSLCGMSEQLIQVQRPCLQQNIPPVRTRAEALTAIYIVGSIIAQVLLGPNSTFLNNCWEWFRSWYSLVTVLNKQSGHSHPVLQAQKVY